MELHLARKRFWNARTSVFLKKGKACKRRDNEKSNVQNRRL